MLVELQEDSLNSLITENEKVVVQFGASWCGACKLTKPKLNRIAQEEANQDVKFFYVDAEKFTESRSITTIQNLPTFVGIVNGEIVAKETGSKIDNINALVNEVANH
jgi:thioredoxin 1